MSRVNPALPVPAYLPWFLATLTMAGRSRRSLNLYPRCTPHDFVVRQRRGIDHLDGLVTVWIEWLALGWDRAYSQLCQSILQLLVNEFDATTKFHRLRLHLQRPLEAIEHGQQRFDGVDASA